MMKIEFFSSIDGVADSTPILEAKEYQQPWFNESKKDYIKQLDFANGGTFAHVYRCPGIFDLYKTGFFITAWCDIKIETNGDPNYYKWTLPNVNLIELMDESEKSPIVEEHSFDGVAKHLPIPPNTLRSIIKINTPWHIMAPKGVKFMMLPVPYSNDFTFTQSIGILDPSVSSSINCQLYWHKLNGEHTIKAGTPLAYIVPITEKKYAFECRDKNKKDESWLKKREFLKNFTFTFKRTAMKSAYDKHNESKCPFTRIFK
jgi:hypothetical protein